MSLPLGLALNGGMLQNLPATASPSDMAAFLNQIIDKLNSWNGVIVDDGVVAVPITSSAQSLTTVPHGLAYTPYIQAAVNGVGIPFTGSNTLSLPLPSFLSANILTSGTIGIYFTIYMFCMADKTNLYFYSLNATGADQGIWDVTYYLMRLNANAN